MKSALCSGRGLATEAVRELLHLGFGQFALHRIVGRCVARNNASAALLRRLGMRQEARFVDSLFLKGKWEEELAFAILECEWCPDRLAKPQGGDAERA
ncbi:GNAT family protein [Micromonospora sp. WMMA1363]|nr:GNAT family protein [Micromonospora sp. WMMA1363]MDM4719610.1 GNAT family protein [Micromonospora sp. WMMA1363]